MPLYAHITGWGMAVPETVLTNLELEKIVETSNDWIISHSGIHERRIADESQTTSSLASDAAIKALEMANVHPSNVDLLIVATSSPDQIFPSTASIVQDKIGANKAGAFDLSAACTGFIYALETASNAIRSGSIQSALVIGAETLSRFINWQDRNTCILFGDGAGAFVLQARETPGGFLASILRSDGSGADLLSLPAGGSKIPATEKTVKNGQHYIQMKGREVFRFATRVMAQSTLEVIQKANLQLEDIQLIVPHQANQRIIETAAKSLNLPLEKFVVNIEHYGNTSTASIPIAICEAVQNNRIKAGDKIVCVAFGAGLTWGAAAIQWSEPLPTKRKIYPSRYRWLVRLRSTWLRWWRHIEGWIWGK